MANKSSPTRRSKRTSRLQSKNGFALQISTDMQTVLSKAIVLGLIVILMGILAYHRIFEPVVWSSLMTLAGYVALSNPGTNTTGRAK